MGRLYTRFSQRSLSEPDERCEAKTAHVQGISMETVNKKNFVGFVVCKYRRIDGHPGRVTRHRQHPVVLTPDVRLACGFPHP